MNVNMPYAIARAIADKIIEFDVVQTEPEIGLVPWYDTEVDRGTKVVVMPSNITTDARVAKNIIRQIFATQVVLMKYLPESSIDNADDVLELAEQLTRRLDKIDIEANGSRLYVNAVVMYGASEVFWNGDWQIDGLLRQESLLQADVFSSSFVAIASRYIVRD